MTRSAKTERVLLALAAVGLVAAAAPLQAERGFGVAAVAGVASVRDDDGSASFREQSFALSGDLEYRFGAPFALGVDFLRITGAEGELNAEPVNLSASAFGLFARLIARVGQRTDAWGKLGVSAYRTSEDNAADIFGAGAYDFALGIDHGDRFALRGELRYVDGEDDEAALVAGGGFVYRF